MALQAVAAALVLTACGWDPRHPAFDVPWPLLAILPAFGAAWLIGALAAPRERRPDSPWGRLQAVTRLTVDDGLTLVPQIGLGVLVAGLAAAHVWIMGLVLLAAATMAQALGRQRRLRLRAETDLAYSAFHDPLTGLPNRTQFTERLAAVFARSRRDGRTFAVLYLDLDRFKLVNDTLGHAAGDQLLVEVAGRLRDCLRPGDTIARLGGDQLTVLLDDVTDVADAVTVAARIVAALAGPVKIGADEAMAPVSIGIALSGTGHQDPTDLLRDADAALYQAKQAGGAGYVVHEPGLADAIAERLRLEMALQRAVATNDVQARYQPRIAFASGRTVEVEISACWEHPEWGWLGPDELERAVRDWGMAVTLDRWLLGEALRQAVIWHAPLAAPPTIAVPFPAQGLQEVAVLEQIGDALADSGAAADRLRLEVREVASADAERVRVATGWLYRRGVTVTSSALEGASQRHRPDLWPAPSPRLAPDLVLAVAEDREAASVAQAIVALADALGVPAIAEGVASAEQAAALRRLGCQLGQGPFFADPQPAAALDLVLAPPPATISGTVATD